MNQNKKWLILPIIAALLFQSCSDYKHLAYFKNVPDSTSVAIKSPKFHPLHIQQGDMLSINVMTIDPSANAIFSQSANSNKFQTNIDNTVSGLNLNSASMSGGGLSNIPVYLVDKNGEIEMPLLGKFKAEGLTTDSLKDLIRDKTAEFYKSPAVIVHFANLKVNVLGEVNRPGSYVLPNEKNTILDALAMAGDLTIFGKRGNVIMIRDSLGFSNMYRFSLNDRDLVKKDFFYLRQNDVLYIEPNRGKAAVNDAGNDRIYAIVASFISVLIIWATRVK